MLSYIKKYPISLFIILTVIYLSFFKPPKTDLSEIPNLDKLVHICMYFGMSGMLWLEFLRAHRRDNAPLWHAWVGAFLCPILFSGCGVAARILHDLPGRRLAGLCRQLNGSDIGESDRLLCRSTENEELKMVYCRAKLDAVRTFDEDGIAFRFVGFQFLYYFLYVRVGLEGMFCCCKLFSH